MDIQKIVQEADEAGQLDALIAAIDPADLAGGIIRAGTFFSIMAQASQRAGTGTCVPEGPSAGTYWRKMELPEAGAWQALHVHNQPHAHFIVHGSAYIEKWDKDFRIHPGAQLLAKVFAGPGSRVDIPNDVYHRILCVEGPYLAHCVFPLMDRMTGKVLYSWDGDVKPYC